MLEFKSERKRFVALVTGVIVTGGLVGWMFLRAWQAGTLDNPFLLLLRDMNISQYTVAAAIAGWFLGLSILLLFDYMKRGQGIILLFGAGAIFAIFVGTGTIIPNWTATSYLILFIMFLFGFLYGGGYGITSGKDQFQKANRGVVWTATLFVFIVFLEAHIHASIAIEILTNEGISGVTLGQFITEAVYDELLIPVDLAVSMGFILLLNQFVGYTDDRSIVVIGPTRAGKTHFLVGIYHLIDQRIGTTDEHDRLAEMHGELLESRKWLPETEKTDELWFEYIEGTVHKRKRTITLHDYPGEVFEYLPDAMDNHNNETKAKAAIQQRIQNNEKHVDKLMADEASDMAEVATGEEEDPVAEAAKNYASMLVGSNFASEVLTADTVLFILDLEAFKAKVGTKDDWAGDDEETNPWNNSTSASHETQNDENGNPLRLTSYLNILKRIDDAESLLVGTKAQTYTKEFTGVDPIRNYNQFQRLVTRKVKKHNKGDQILNRIGNNAEVIPVYIDGDEDGPDTGPAGTVDLTTIGYDAIKKEIEQ